MTTRPAPTLGELEFERIELERGGLLTVVLTWSTADDLDLALVETDGSTVDFNAGPDDPTSSGAEHSGDSNAGCRSTGSEEAVAWPSGNAPTGNLLIRVDGYDVCEDGRYRLEVRSGDVVARLSGAVAQGERDAVLLTVVDPRPTTTTEATPTTGAPTTIPTTGVAEAPGARRELDRSAVGGTLLGIGAALVLVLLARVAGRRPVAAPAASAPAGPVAIQRLAVIPPRQTRELLNHTIHRLDAGMS
ncbi:MAG: hypothetical protein H0W25_06085 [Acidimicrobiia bacterium]|nr:hypothetical protein [Acidimicrobiia bacterium]